MKIIIFVRIYIVVSLLFLVGVFISFYNYSYYGYYADKIISWCWLAFTIAVLICFWKNKAIKIYFYSILTLLFLSVLPMAIPFFGIVYYFSTIDDYQAVVLNKEYRIERTKQSALSTTKIYIYKKAGVFEKNISRIGYAEIVESVLAIDQFEKEWNENKIPIEKAELIGVNQDSIGIEYQILGKRKVIFHKIKKDDGY